ncbi:hypothetical protein [Saccharopolyspora sp. NPDC049357]|uniref:hypothetical protein n=1 Tax=Saccharopolyspora sp. NPDC049357 TaxID=3154507 RepID=UPI0034449842
MQAVVIDIDGAIIQLNLPGGSGWLPAIQRAVGGEVEVHAVEVHAGNNPVPMLLWRATDRDRRTFAPDVLILQSCNPMTIGPEIGPVLLTGIPDADGRVGDLAPDVISWLGGQKTEDVVLAKPLKDPAE